MTHEEELEETVVVARDAADDPERTIVRPRRNRAASVEDTVVVDRSDDAESTIIVRRRPKLLGLEPDGDDDDDDTGRTARPRDEFDVDTDRTVARPRVDEDDEATITVDRSAPAVSLPPVPSLRRARVQRRRGIAPPPVPVGFAPAARLAVGPGAVEHYRPRELAPPPNAPAHLEASGTRVRVVDPSLPSIARRARRTATVAVAAFVGACAVSATGLTLILIWVL